MTGCIWFYSVMREKLLIVIRTFYVRVLLRRHFSE